MSRFVGIAGILTIIGIALLASENRRQIPWRMVLWAILLQLVFGVVILKTNFGQMALREAATAVTALIRYADFGGAFVFGHLSRDPTPYIFAFRVLPIVIFISSFFTCLYHLGIMQLIVVAMAKIMKRFLGVSGAESLATGGVRGQRIHKVSQSASQHQCSARSIPEPSLKEACCSLKTLLIRVRFHLRSPSTH